MSGAPRVRVLGSRHSFTDIADSDELSRSRRCPRDVAIDRARHGLVRAGVRYGDLADALAGEGLALHNLASLPHISVAGAVATATHGSGDGNGNLATAVAALEMVTSDGEIVAAARGDAGLRRHGRRARRARRGDPGDARRPARLRGPPARVRGPRVGRALHPLRRDHRRSATASASSPAGATTTDQVWVKSVVTDAPAAPPPTCSARGRRPSTATRSSASTRSTARPSSARPARGRIACRTSAWASRRAPARSSSPSTSCRAADAVAAIEAVRGAGRPARARSSRSPRSARSPPTTLWISPQYGQDTVGIHFTWKPEPAVERACSSPSRRRSRPFGARPHWGKPFLGRRRGHRAAVRAPADFRRSPSGSTRAAPSATRGSSAGCSASRPSGRRPARACRAGTSGPSPADG